MIEHKKEWLKPELIVLLRSKPEEAVLDTCKGGAFLGSQGNTHNHCWELQVMVCPNPCFTVGSS
jgi:hypothetical protein